MYVRTNGGITFSIEKYLIIQINLRRKAILNLKGIFQYFGKYTNLLSCCKSEKIDTNLMSDQ